MYKTLLMYMQMNPKNLLIWKSVRKLLETYALEMSN